MTILTKDAVGDYPLPTGGATGSAPSAEQTIVSIASFASVAAIVSQGSWGTEVGTRAWYDRLYPGKYYWVPVPAHPEWGFVNTLIDAYGYEITYTTIPATSGSPFVPSSIDPVALAAYYNEGWNTWARSIGALQKGQVLEFSVSPATTGAMVIFGPSGAEGTFNTADTRCGFVISNQVISLINESATTIDIGADTNFGVNGSGVRLYMYRLYGGQIAFRVGSHIEIAPYAEGHILWGHVYGMLYRAFDSITFAQITTATLWEAQPTVSVTSRLIASTGTAASLSGKGTLLVPITKLVESTVTGTGVLTGEVDRLTRGAGDLPLYAGLGADYEYGLGSGSLPYYTQPQIMPEYGWATTPYFFGYAYGSDHDVGSGDVPTFLYAGFGADYEYGFGEGALPYYAGGGQEGFADQLVLFDIMVTGATATLAIDLVLVLNSDGGIESSFSMTREQALAFLSSLSGGDQHTLLGAFGLSLLTSVRGGSLQSAAVGDAADIQNNGAVWVVNLATKASSQYEGYGFNSFFRRDGKAYGVASDGIYILEGDTDAGQTIESLVSLARMNFDAPGAGVGKLKQVHNLYLGVASSKAMILKVDSGGVVRHYLARTSSKDVKNHRVDIGKGVEAAYWQFTLLNNTGCDFDLAGIEFEPIILSRRI